MNLTLHIVRKDLLRMRVWIACWVALLLAPIVIGAWFIANNPLNDADWSLPDKLGVLTILELLVAYLLTILVLQEDGVVGTTQFWLTRPVSRGRMLVAKAISALVIVGLVPVVVSVPWWSWCGFGVGQIAAAAAEMLVVLFVAMVPGALVAVLTDSLARALLWTVALVAVITFGGGFYLASVRDNQLLVPTRLIAMVVFIAAELAVVVAVQFHVRRRGWWLGVATVVVVCTFNLMARGMWRPWNAYREPREHDASRVPDLRAQFLNRAEAGEISGRVEFKPDALPVWQRVSSRVVVGGVPSDLLVFGQVAKQRWSWPGGPVVERLEPFDFHGGFYFPRGLTLFGLKDATIDEEVKRFETEQLEQRIQWKFAPDEEFAEFLAWLQPSMVARMRKEPPAFEARLWWQVARPELRLEVPLAPTRWTTRHGHGIGIERIDRNPDFMITMVTTRPVLLLPLMRSMDEWRREFEPDNEQSWALLDHERGVVTYVFGERHADKPRYVVVNGVKIEWRKHFTAGPGKMRDGKWVRDPEWRTGTSLAVFTLHDEAVVSRDVKVERYLFSK